VRKNIYLNALAAIQPKKNKAFLHREKVDLEPTEIQESPSRLKKGGSRIGDEPKFR